MKEHFKRCFSTLSDRVFWISCLGQERAITKSKYEEDVYVNNHKVIFLFYLEGNTLVEYLFLGYQSGPECTFLQFTNS